MKSGQLKNLIGDPSKLSAADRKMVGEIRRIEKFLSERRLMQKCLKRARQAIREDLKLEILSIKSGMDFSDE